MRVGRERVVKARPTIGRFLELITVWGLGFAGAAAIFAPGVEEALVARGAFVAGGPGTESVLAALFGAAGVAIAAAKWFVESTVWLRQ